MHGRQDRVVVLMWHVDEQTSKVQILQCQPELCNASQNCAMPAKIVHEMECLMCIAHVRSTCYGCVADPLSAKPGCQAVYMQYCNCMHTMHDQQCQLNIGV